MHLRDSLFAEDREPNVVLYSGMSDMLAMCVKVVHSNALQIQIDGTKENVFVHFYRGSIPSDGGTVFVSKPHSSDSIK